MTNRIVGNLENILLIYGIKKPLHSPSYLPILPDAIHDEFEDAKVITENASNEQAIYKVYYLIDGYEYQLGVNVSYRDDSITILADDANIAMRAYRAIGERLAQWKEDHAARP